MKPSPISLLIVDDDPVFSRFLGQLVKVLDAELACVSTSVDTAEKALDELGGRHYDLALLDYNLPGVDGLKLLEVIQSLPSSQQPAVIMLTGSGNETIAVEAMKSGARDYLCKADLDVLPLLRGEIFAAECLTGEGVANAEHSVSFVTEEEMADLHVRYMAEEGPTDVLSFPLDETDEDGVRVRGDVVIAPAVAAMHADELGVTVESELNLLLTHGILHLLGYEHDTEEGASVMQERERVLLSSYADLG